MSSTPCEECENKGYFILDTNFLIFLLDYLYNQNPRLRIRDYCSKLNKILQALAGCCINGHFYVSTRLYDEEIDYFNNNRAALFTKSKKFYRPFMDPRSDIKQVLGVIKSFLTIITIDDNDLNLIQEEASGFFRSNPPDKNDLSLLLLALNLSNNDSDGNSSLIISGDMKLRNFQENHFCPLEIFENHQGDALICTNIKTENRFDPIARVYSCCKLETIDSYFDHYSEDVKQMLRDNISVKDSYDRKFDVFKEIAIKKNGYDLKKQINLTTGVCVE